MNLPLIPFRFRPVYKDYLWGGTRIAERYGREGTPSVCAESWEVSAHPNGMSIVEGGPFDGCGLADLCKRFGPSLLGTMAPEARRFPLLFKIIDASKNLSVQVHPSPADPMAKRNEIKNESWFILEDDSSTKLCAGFRDDVDRALLERALATGAPRIDTLIRHLPVRKDEILFIRAGLVHAICAGCLIYEVQQNADVTYRFYDWDRVDANGRKRPLHLEEAMRSIDWTLPPATLASPVPIPETPGLDMCLKTPFFTLHRATPDGTMALRTRGESFHVLFVNQGAIRLSLKDGEMDLPLGSSALVPAAAGEYTITSLEPGSKALLTHL